jgi:hypothetical protein
VDGTVVGAGEFKYDPQKYYRDMSDVNYEVQVIGY